MIGQCWRRSCSWGLILWLTISSLLPGILPWGNITSQHILAISAIAVVLVMIVTRCLTTSEARSAIDLQVIITIAAALGLGEALDRSGAARWLAQVLVSGTSAVGFSEAWLPYVLLAAVYVASQIFTEMITNVAVASTMIPVSIGVAAEAGYNPRPFIIAVTLAASLSFITPIGYQTNLMVMGPGGYQPRDFLRTGLPLAALLTVAASGTNSLDLAVLITEFLIPPIPYRKTQCHRIPGKWPLCPHSRHDPPHLNWAPYSTA